MLYTSLGRSGAQVSRIALGTLSFGPLIDESGSRQILDAAVEMGITLIDTADVYGGPPHGDHPGRSEEIVGGWIAERGVRDDIVLATKGFGSMGPRPNDRGLSAIHLRHAVDASLRRLRTDRIDLYQLHHIDRTVPLDEVLDAVTALRAAGKILYVGSSNFAGWHLAHHQDTARASGRAGLVTEQSVYNLAQRTVEAELIPAAQHFGIGLLPYSPLARGQLGGILSKQEHRRSDLGSLGERRAQIERYERFAMDRGVHPAVLGVAWLLHQPVVTAPVVGPRRLEHLQSAVDALDIALGADDLAELDRIFPGPGRAPESYAW